MGYEELQEKVERLENSIDWIKTKFVELLEEKGLAPVKTSYEVEVPDDLEDFYYIDETGLINRIYVYDEEEQEKVFKRALAFKTKEQAEKYDKERILLFKLYKWAEEHNGGWIPDWEDLDENKYNVTYDYDENKFRIKSSWYENKLSKLPCFISYDIAQQFVEEFGEEIIEVLF